MPQFVLYIDQSLDGYIADIQGSTNWLHELPNPDQSDYGFHEFLAGVGQVLMGRKTYESILGFDIPWPYPQQLSYILSRKNLGDLPEGIEQLHQLDTNTVQQLKSKSEKDIWLIGGGELVKQSIEAKLLDKIILFTMPISLGKGIRLFPESEVQSHWKLSRCEVYSSGVIEHEYLPQS